MRSRRSAAAKIVIKRYNESSILTTSILIMKKYTARTFLDLKGKTPITMLTAYTTPVAKSLEQAGIPIILVGDSVGMVEMGMDSTRTVTIEQMCYHVSAVRRGNTRRIRPSPDSHEQLRVTAYSCA